MRPTPFIRPMATIPPFDARAFAARLRAEAVRVDGALDALLSPSARPHERARPKALIEAMRYGALAPGKRLRPYLTIETARALGLEGDAPVRVGAAVECLHAYSLIHDDLPAMDDDDLRRGRATTHIAHGEATAILAGDGLQTLAFEILADPATSRSATVRANLCLALARAAGLAGMVGGQALDMEAERRLSSSLDEVALIQALKTGALLAFSVKAGAILSGARAPILGALTRYGEAMGAAFQVADDILDFESDAATMGKRTGKDADRNKATFVSALGLEAAKASLRRRVDEALAALGEAKLGPRGDGLAQAALFAAERKS